MLKTVVHDGKPRTLPIQGANWALTALIGLLLLTAVSSVPLTLTVLQLRQFDALVIDLAGQQRMLLERHMKEVLLAADNVASAYQESREILSERLRVLIGGGLTYAGIDRQEQLVLPPAPSEDIRNMLIRQQDLWSAFVQEADHLLEVPRGSTMHQRLRQDLLEDNGRLLRVANEAVAMLARHAESRVRTVIRWEIVVVVLVVVVASLGTVRFVQTEHALKESQATAMEALRQSDALKSALLSSVSHELRTPLTAIKAMLSNLQADQGTQSAEVRQEFMAGMHEELDYLNQLVGNLLDMSRIEAGTLKPNREWHMLDELVEGAIRRVGPRLERRTLSVELPVDLPPIHVDGMAVQQVLINLLDNAVKYSPDGAPVRVAARIIGQNIEVSVTNVGMGIPASDLERIFDRFYRVTGRYQKTTPGVGLGLAICKGIVEAHGGRIEARSQVPGETVIAFRLPLRQDVPRHETTVAQAHESERPRS